MISGRNPVVESINGLPALRCLLVMLQSLLEALIEDIARTLPLDNMIANAQLLAPTKITVTRMMFPKHGISIR